MKKNKYGLKFLFFLVLILPFLSIWGFLFANRLETLFYNPLITPEEWCQVQPCITFNLFGITITFVKPSSSLIVYFLGFQTTILGCLLFYFNKKEKSILWWGIALILWGLGALFAGTSYQAFSYEIKCAGNSFCTWTSWYEIIYLILSVGSVNSMLIAQIYSCIKIKNYKLFWIYAISNFVIYITIILIGAYIPIRFLISFELMVLFLCPNIGFFLILNIWRYKNNKNRMDRNLIMIWISLIIIIGLYFLYYILGITEFLWKFSFWFSENDILHIGLIIWISYIYFTVKNRIVDFYESSQN